jgi:hypothetical protein
MAENEVWDWKKALYGFVDPVRVLKDAFTAIRLVIIVIICYLLFVGGVAIWKRWIPAKKEPKPPITQTTGNITGGDKSKLDMSTGERTTKWGVITF